MNQDMSRRGVSPIFVILAVLFCVCLIISNLLEIKTVDIGFMTITAGVIVFPISYIINDCIVEVYGFARARFVIWVGFAMSLLVVILTQVAIWLPGGTEWASQSALETIFGAVPRITAASFIAFVCGSMVNAYVMSRMKLASKGRHFSIRAIASTLVGESVDSCIFFPIAFVGILPWPTIATLIVTQAVLKTIYEIIALPLTSRVVKALKRIERVDTYDRGINYAWWRLSDILPEQPH